ncbi:four helix bundle protein [Flagellimonas meishanensis]|uniref:four helix bundle protein n=1 Tax=Flagellimonas meishanensis TaxID=2873264 RepID=UPI003AAE8751
MKGEGCSKFSQIDFVLFLQISSGSAYELDTFLILYGDLEFFQAKELEALLKKSNYFKRESPL